MLNTPTDVGERFLSPAFKKLAGCSRLVLFNDAIFSEADFEGLRHVGLGGKRGLANTHGRHGLGALSFYYFTDVVTVISGEYVMFLDPSGENLPPRRHGKRTALRRTIKQVVNQFPDQLKGYESLFKFTASSGFFEGTLFILPLKSSISEQQTSFLDVHDMVKSSYKTLSANAFFFTTLQRISAYKNAESDNEDHLLWSFEASRQSPIGLDDRYTRHTLTLKHRCGRSAPITEKWFIVTSSGIEIPQIHSATAEGLNLSRESPLSVQLAIRTDNAGGLVLNSTSSLFSTLQLPKLISLPFHINSRFAISSNRQNVVMHPAGSDNQLDPKTAYNIWILKELIPPLYLSCLDYLVHSSQRKLFYRDVWWLLNAKDDISRLVQAAFYGILTESTKLLFQDATNDWIAFHDAVFSASQPSQITELLTSIKAPQFVLYEHLKGMANCKSASTVDGRFVKQVLVVTGLHSMRNLISAKKLDTKGIARIMDYVRKEDDLAMLPLLVLASGTLVQIPDKNMPAVYRSVPDTVSALFSTGRFMAPVYTLESANRLLEDENINVVEITPSSMAGLIIKELNSKGPDAQKSWLDLFWRAFPILPASPNLTLLEDGKIVQGSSRTLKLSECKNDRVVYQSHGRSPAIEPPIANMLHKLGLEIVNVTANPILDGYLKPKFADTISNVLLCMEAKGIYNLAHLTEAERQNFSHWIRNHLPATISKWNTQGSLVSPHFLKRIEIWNAQTFEGQSLHSVMGIKLLPSNVPPNRIRPFQKPDIVVSEYSYTLYTFIQFLSQANIPPKTLSAKAIMDVVDVPRQIGLGNEAGITAMKDFVASMISLPPNEVRHACLHVPDRHGILRPIGTLFDDRMPLFSTTLHFTQPSSFVHPAFQGLQDQFRGLGLNHQVNSQTFAMCARAIENALQLHRNGVLERNILFEMSDAAYEVYQTQLPTLLMMDENKWNSIDSINFVRRKQERREGATYDVERYFDEPLPLLVSPSLCVRQHIQSIAWTQRALFHRDPSAEVIALNPTIGIPSAKEVVEHLKILALRIAPHHNNDASLIDDLAATYTWLNAHIDDAKEYLLECRNMPLYLNVNDPRNDTWDNAWSRGTEMVLGLHYDTARLKRVGQFLDRYNNLLDASGCITMKALNLIMAAPTQNVRNVTQDLRNTFNEMRKAAELTDVALIPTATESSATVPAKDDPELRAHYSFLAATMPYVRRHAQGWSATKPGEIKFFGSTFGAKALLGMYFGALTWLPNVDRFTWVDFAYTGDFKRPAPTADAGLTALLNDLLELLPIADEWDIPQFKCLIEHKIIHEYDMIQKLPHHYSIMVQQADVYSAENLRKALTQFQKENADFLRVLQDAS
ncbi:Sacsin [Psilocybe cubensis]|uniref:Sacsin n=1 Tax=Psilocybe cubensis TaxID=181762 RepID=A0ACB8GFX3_PSICU|nr:Sacsin [Psilocybe cubensis]KAH9474330.1 Sacsin [Psilocybe cubensis]